MATFLSNSSIVGVLPRDNYEYEILEQQESGYSYSNIYLMKIHREPKEKETISTSVSFATKALRDGLVYRCRLFSLETTRYPDLWRQAEAMILANTGTPATPEDKGEVPSSNTDKRYRIDITTNLYNPEIPKPLIDKMRSFAAMGGWNFIDIAPSEDGYTAIVEKFGSVTIAVLVTIGIVAFLATIGVVVVNWKATKLSTNTLKRDQIVTEENTKQTILQGVIDGRISKEDAETLINMINSLYNAGSGSGSTTTDTLKYAAIALLGVAVIGALK